MIFVFMWIELFTTQKKNLNHPIYYFSCPIHKIFVAMSQKCHLNIPPLIVCSLFVGCYYVYVISFCTSVKQSILVSVLYILGLNFFFFMAIWCFFVTLFTPQAPIPDRYQLTSEDLDLLHDEMRPMSMHALCEYKNVELFTRTPRGLVR